MLGAATNASLREFDSAEFHDRLQRARNNSGSALQVAMAGAQVIAAVVSAAGVTVGLAVVSPWLVPITLLSCVPLWLVGAATARRCIRSALAIHRRTEPASTSNVLCWTARPPRGTRVRLAAFLRERWSRLYDERIQEIRTLVRRFVRAVRVGAGIGSLMLCAVLVLVLILVRHGEMPGRGGGHGMRGNSDAGQPVAGGGEQPRANDGQQLYVEEFIELRALERNWCRSPRSDRTVPRACRRQRIVPLFSGDTNAVDGVMCRSPPASDRNCWPERFRKTTLAKLLSGLYEPSDGQIRWTAPTVPTHHRWWLSEAGVVFQDFRSYWFSAATTLRSVTWTGPTSRRNRRSSPRCRRHRFYRAVA